MHIALLAIGDQEFYLDPDGANQALNDVRVARETGNWLDLSLAGGAVVKLLIPLHALLVFREFDVEGADGEVDDNAWLAAYDF